MVSEVLKDITSNSHIHTWKKFENLTPGVLNGSFTISLVVSAKVYGGGISVGIRIVSLITLCIIASKFITLSETDVLLITVEYAIVQKKKRYIQANLQIAPTLF